MVLGLDGGVCEPVGAVGDNSGEDVVEAHNAGVVEQVNEEGNGVIDGAAVTEVGSVEGGGISVGDIEVVDSLSSQYNIKCDYLRLANIWAAFMTQSVYVILLSIVECSQENNVLAVLCSLAIRLLLKSCELL